MLAEQFLNSKEPANGYDNLTVIHLSWNGPQAVLLTGSLSHGLYPELPGKFEHSWHTRAKAVSKKDRQFECRIKVKKILAGN